MIAVRGASGAGKTTFLKLVSGILLPTRGRVLYGDTEVSALSEPRRDRWRGRHVGFLFQDFRLFDGLTALENVLLPFTFCSRTVSNTQRRDATDLLKLHGVNPDTRSELLSRGEMQRTALVRVLMQSPSIILADEPTASLDANRAGHAVRRRLARRLPRARKPRRARARPLRAPPHARRRPTHPKDLIHERPHAS